MMNRKDTILVAVLVNVGVLLILFISSLKPHSQQELQALKMEQPFEEGSKIARVEAVKPELKEEGISKEFSQAIEQLLKNEETKTSNLEIAKEVSKSEANVVAVEVKSGDVLGKIAKEMGSSVDEIKKVNHMNDDRVVTGQTLLVPQLAQKEKKSEAPAKSKESEDRYYTVKNGDNPWTIATKNHIKVEELLRLNGLDEAKAKKIKPGDRLRIK